MRIPEIQRQIQKLVDELLLLDMNDGSRIDHANKIKTLAKELSRRRPITRARATSTPMSDRLKAEIISLHTQDTSVPFNIIAARLNINPGRVSETLRGFRK